MSKQTKKKIKSTPLQTFIIIALIALAIAVNIFGSFLEKKDAPPEPTQEGAITDDFKKENQ